MKSTNVITAGPAERGFWDAVDAKISAGSSRRDAIGAVVREKPAAHRAMLDEINGRASKADSVRKPPPPIRSGRTGPPAAKAGPLTPRALTDADRAFFDARKGLGPKSVAYWSAVETHYAAGLGLHAAGDKVEAERPDLVEAYRDERAAAQRAIGGSFLA